MQEVVKDWDCSIKFGFRHPAEQLELFKIGRVQSSNGEYYRLGEAPIVTNCDGYVTPSMHNYELNGEPCSLAIDVVPYFNGHVSWAERDCAYFAGKVMEKARAMGIPLRWGCDWDSDNDTNDNTLNDLVHFELKGVK